MAQLPPKVPNLSATTSNWYDISHQKMCTSSWVDEFLDYSSVKRGTHRRSASDPHHGGDNGGDNRFDGFVDDEKFFMSMFNHHETLPPQVVAGVEPTLSSSPSDNNSINDEKNNDYHYQQQNQCLKNEWDEVQSSCKSESHLATTQPTKAAINDGSDDRIFDPKRVKRILSNRQSAQRSRVRKLQYISELERSVNSLQAEVSVLSPSVAFLDHQRLLLNVDNSALKQRIATLAQDKLFKDAHQEALKREIERLRQVYQQQQHVSKTGIKPPPSPPSSDTNGSTEKEGEFLLV